MNDDKRSVRLDWLLALLACVVFGLVGARWLWLFRRGGPLDIDEAGYQSIAVLNHRALLDEGLGGWVTSVLSPSIQAPLMTASTTPSYLVFGVGSLAALLVPLAYAVVALLAGFGLGHAIGGRRTAWLCLALMAASPLVITYSRSYNFAIASTAMIALTLWALARSRNFATLGWSLAAGAFLGLMVLSRTMTLAFVPGLVLAAAVAVVAGPDRLRRLLHVLAGVVVALVVAGPWYWRNGVAVWDYLFAFGYGSRSDEYGAEESIVSATSWLHSLQYALQSDGLLTLAVTALGLLVLLGQMLRRCHVGLRPGAIAAATSLMMPSALFLGWGLLVFTSSGNKGTGFLASLVPAMAVLASAGLARLEGRKFLVATVISCFVLLLNTSATADLRTPLAKPRSVAFPTVGPAFIADGRGAIHSYLAAGMKDPGSGARPISAQQERLWSEAIRAVRRQIAADTATTSTGFGFRHRLLNPNSVQLAQVTAGAAPLPLTMVTPEQAADDAGISAWLGADGVAESVCTLLLASGLAFEIEPVVDQAAMRRVARIVGFAPTGEEWRLPDGRVIKPWRRASC